MKMLRDLAIKHFRIIGRHFVREVLGDAIRELTRLALIPVLLANCFMFAGIAPARSQAVKLVGTGATSCARYLQDIDKNPMSEREYFAWAQGLMSGVMVRAPNGTDETLDLAPADVPIIAQMDIIHGFCAKHPDADYGEAVHTLYSFLGGRAMN